MRFSLSDHSAVIAAVCLAACSSSSEPAPSASIRLSGAANAVDTVEAKVAEPLVVEVRDAAGVLAPAGTEVHFSAPVTDALGAEVRVAPSTLVAYKPSLTSVVDQTGRATVLISFGIGAGPGRLAVSVPTLGIQDTARFTITPGNAVGAAVVPSDTVVVVGGSYTARGGAVDRWRNLRPDPVTWSGTGTGVTVASSGQVTATAVGRYGIAVTGSAGTASGSLSVVPLGRLVVTSTNSLQTTLSTMDTDGSHETIVTTADHGSQGVLPAWIPGTNTIVYMSFTGAHTLYTVTPPGTATRFIAAPPPTMTQQVTPRPTADGKWVYFGALDSRCSTGGGYCVARARVDGSAPELVISTSSSEPAPSPDGSKVAYLSAAGMKVFDVATRTESTWTITGYWPAWSPDGTRIAYLAASGALSVMSPDGTGATTLSPVIPMEGPIAWSSDGKWVLGRSNGAPALIDPNTGVVLRITYPIGRFAWSIK
jgi:Tol biopolymer transport system component